LLARSAWPKISSIAAGRIVLRCFTVTVALVLVLDGRSMAAVNIWLSGTESITPGSSFPTAEASVPILQPYLAGTGTIYIWGRPDAGKSLVDLSLNLVAETQPLCGGCIPPNAITFTSATVFNDAFGAPLVKRFEYVDDSTNMSPLPISANRVDGMEGLRIFEGGAIPAVGIGNVADPRYDALHNSWLIAQVNYNALASGALSVTRLYLEIGPVGMNHADEATTDCLVLLGDAADGVLNAHDNRGAHAGQHYDAMIQPRSPVPGDADGNMIVNMADYGVWRANFGSTMMLHSDHNMNGVIDGADYVIWRNNLGFAACSGGANAIPEPCAAILTSLLMSALLACCRLSLRRGAR